MDNVVDELYRTISAESIRKTQGRSQCYITGTLILRYIERIADHAEDVGESVAYTVTGKRTPQV